MPKTITFNELRRIKASLPEGSTHVIAEKLNLSVQTVRNYFGGSNYDTGIHMGVHIEPGPDGGIVVQVKIPCFFVLTHCVEKHSLLE